jgi:hypothetical protein
MTAAQEEAAAGSAASALLAAIEKLIATIKATPRSMYASAASASRNGRIALAGKARHSRKSKLGGEAEFR